MGIVRILTNEEWNQIHTAKPIIANGIEQQSMKQMLFKRVNEVYADKWSRLKVETRKAIEKMLFLASDKGISFIGRETLAEELGINERTIRRVIEDFKAHGIAQVVYRRSRKGNGRGNPVLLFVEHPFYERWKALLGLENTVNVQTDVQTEKSVTPSETRDSEPKKVSTIDITKNILKDNTYISDAYSSDNQLDFNNYENNPEKFASAAGVPQEIIEELRHGMKTSEIVKAWISIRRTLDKYKATYEQYQDEILTTVSRTIGIYYSKKNKISENFNFAACICGLLKKAIRGTLTEKLEKYYASARKGFYDWLSALSDQEKQTARLIGALSIPDADELPY